MTLAGPPLAIAVLEVGLRVGGYQHVDALALVVWNPVEDALLESDDGLHRPDAELLWSPRPGAVVVRGSDERINAAGYRGPLLAPGAPPAGTLRVALLGESTTFGLSVPWEYSLAGRLPERLAPVLGPEARVEVLDAAVAGHSILQGLARWRGLVREHRPDVVVAAFGLNNEQLPCVQSDAEKLAAASARPAWSGAWSVLHDECRVAQLVCQALGPADGGRAAPWIDGPGSAAEVGRVDWPGRRRVSLPEFEAALCELVREVRAAGARLILVGLPRLPEVERRAPVLAQYTAAIESAARREGIEYLDGASAAREWCSARACDLPELFQPREGFHLSPLGHEMLAAGLATMIAAPTVR